MGIPSRQFATILKTERKKNHLTQAELAEILNISLPYLKDLERARNNPSYEMFERIIRYFNLSADDVIYPVKNSEDYVLKKIQRLLTRCSKEQLQIILTVIETLLTSE